MKGHAVSEQSRIAMMHVALSGLLYLETKMWHRLNTVQPNNLYQRNRSISNPLPALHPCDNICPLFICRAIVVVIKMPQRMGM